MEHEIVNRETPEMKQLISGIQEVSKRIREIAQTLQDYRDKGIIPYTQIAGKILYRLSDLEKLLEENYKQRSF